MEKAIFYKEWIKVRYFFLVSTLVFGGFTGYTLLRINRVIQFKGVGHLWEILLQRDTVFIELQTYLPLITGLLFALIQFVPEMQQKRLKLTLHLPYAHHRMIMVMLMSGVSLLLLSYALNFGATALYLSSNLAVELTSRILLTSLPWYLAGVAAYFLVSWICLEPSWKRRIVNLLISAAFLRVFFLSPTPQAYDGFLWSMFIYTLFLAGFSLLSVDRFKRGVQD